MARKRKASKSILALKRRVHELSGEPSGEEPDLEWPGDVEPKSPSDWYEAMGRRLLLGKIDGLGHRAEHIEVRRGVFFDVSMLGVSAEERHERALGQMAAGFEVLSGLNEVWGWVAERSGAPRGAPEWASRAYDRGVELCDGCDERAARVLLGVVLAECSEPLDWLVRSVLWFTQSHARVRAHCWAVSYTHLRAHET